MLILSYGDPGIRNITKNGLGKHTGKIRKDLNNIKISIG